MPTFRSEVLTENGSRYLQQLCKHWSHRFPAEFDARHGTVRLNDALCTFDAEPQRLLLRLDNGDERLCGVVTDHLKRFAFREELSVDWLGD